MPLGQHVGVEHDLFRLFRRTALTGIDRVLFSLLVARVVIIVVAPVRHRHVGLLEPPFDLFEQFLLEVARMRHFFGGVFVLLIQMLDDLGILPLAQPIVVIHAHMAVLLKLSGYFLGHRHSPSDGETVRMSF